MIKVICGNEPYWVDFYTKQTYADLSMPEINLMRVSSFTEEAYNFLFSQPIMDEKKVVLVECEDLKNLEGGFFDNYKNAPSPFGHLVCKAKVAKGNTKFYKELAKEGLLTSYDKEDVVKQLPSFIQRVAASMGAFFVGNALTIFLGKMCYGECEDVNLYILWNELKNLVALDKNITPELVEQNVAQRNVSKIFGVAKMITTKDISSLMIQAHLLADEAIQTLSALLREYRIAYKAKFYSLKEIGVSYCLLKDLSVSELEDGVNYLAERIAGIKNGSIGGELILKEAFLRLSR